ncbi:MAG: nuclear transport factor 2 family protein, partial [Pseudomonadales bacterium]|nr:nuclear transport factor 2 family protein [Pseudomonadales bacterium]
MDEAARLAAERGCTALVHEWARAVDFGDQDHFLELVEADGRLVYGSVHEGLEALARFVGSR